MLRVIPVFLLVACAEPIDPPEPFCGDGAIDIGEACDDGNFFSADGCSASCFIEHPLDVTWQLAKLDGGSLPCLDNQIEIETVLHDGRGNELETIIESRRCGNGHAVLQRMAGDYRVTMRAEDDVGQPVEAHLDPGGGSATVQLLVDGGYVDVFWIATPNNDDCDHIGATSLDVIITPDGGAPMTIERPCSQTFRTPPIPTGKATVQVTVLGASSLASEVDIPPRERATWTIVSIPVTALRPTTPPASPSHPAPLR